MTDGQRAAASPRNTSVLEWAVTAWRDGISAVQQMSSVLGIGALAIIALDVLSQTFIPQTIYGQTSFGVDLSNVGSGLAKAILLTPVAIAVHRFVLLGERTTSYRLSPSDPRFRRFVLFSIMIELLFWIAYVLMNLGQRVSGWIESVSTLVFLVALLVGSLLTLGTLILFPAIAVDAPSATWSNALYDSRGRLWRMLLIVIATGIPLYAVGAVVEHLLYWLVDPRVTELCYTVLGAVWVVLMTAIYAALASRLYAACAERLTHAPIAGAA